MLRMKHVLVLGLVSAGLAGWAQAADLGVSRYQVISPAGDIYRGADVTFEIDVENNDLTPVSDAELAINVPPTMVVSVDNVPPTCVASGFTAPQTLTCTVPTLIRDGGNPDYTLSYVATAETADAIASTATISSPTNTDTNASNDSLTIIPTVSSGADVSIQLAASVVTIPAGGRYTYTAQMTNNGPDAVSEAQVIFALPPNADFGYVSVSTGNWSCRHNGGVSQTVTCDYIGSAIASGGLFPQIVVTGDADIQSGTLSAQADIALTEVSIGDPNTGNNLADPEVVTITPGTDLRGRIIISPSFITGDTDTFRLIIDNLGPTDIGAGATITHDLPSNLVLDGVLPAGCSIDAGTITCSVSALQSGRSETFTIPIRADSDTGGNITVRATAVPPSGIIDPVSSNDTGTDVFRIEDPAADVFLQSKAKDPNPIRAGQNMTSTIRIENNGPSIIDWSPSNPIVITDDLGPNETYVSVSTAGWSCATAPSPDPAYTNRVTCSTTDSGSLGVDNRKTLRIVTQAGSSADVNLRNNACVDTSALIVVDPSPSNNCRTRGVRATTEVSNLSLVSEISLDSATGYGESVTLPASAVSHFIRLTLSNAAGSDTARTVNITTSDLSPWMRNSVSYNGGSVLLSTGVSIFSADAGISCTMLASTSDDITCTATDLLPGESRTLIFQVDRPLLSGTHSTAFTMFSPDTIETDNSDNTDSVAITVIENADLIINDKRISPNPTQSGGTATYLVDVKNIGPNTGEGVIVTDFVDAALFEVVEVTTTAFGGTCDYGVTTANTATCRLGEIDRAETFQMAITVRPRFPFNGGQNAGDFPVSHTNTAEVTTTTFETDTTNNTRDLIHDVNEPSLDLRLTNDEPSGFTEPSIYPDTLLYEVQVRNGGVTQGTGIVAQIAPNPAVGYEMAYNAAASTLPVGVSCAQASNGDPVICTMPDLANNEAVSPILAFDVIDAGGGEPIGSLTFGTTASVVSDQQVFDVPTANNSATQTTTVIPSTDLEVVSKTRVSPAPPIPINLSEPIVYDIVFRNNGTSATTQIRLTDTLPEGFERTSTDVVFTPSGTASVSGSSCSPGRTVLCTVDGFFPANGDSVTMRLEAVARYPFTGVTTDPVVNSVTIAVGQTPGGAPISVDEVSTNNSASTSDGLLRVSSIAGFVYDDANRNDTFDLPEGISGVDLTLSGTDLYGNAVSATVQTDTNGVFTFEALPPSDATGYTIRETQPVGYVDYRETAGTVAGVVDNASFGDEAAFNTISGIVLAEGTNAAGYQFAEYAEAEVSGAIYADLNNNGTRDGGEPGIGSGYAIDPHVRITGTDYTGTSVDRTASVDANGAYTFSDLPPSDSTGYVLTQLVEPDGFYDGLEENGSGNTIANSINGTEQIDLGVINPGDRLSDRNFAQLPVVSLFGLIYEDTNKDGLRQPTETETFSGGVVELSGTDDLGRMISCRMTTVDDGVFSFPAIGCSDLRPGSYTLALVGAPGRIPSGGVAGTLGGTPDITSIASISLSGGVNGADYLFGVTIGSIIADDNDFVSSPVNRGRGGETPSVFMNDTLNGSVVANGEVIPAIINDGGVMGVEINSDGSLHIPALTPVGLYTIAYEICETLNPDNCDPATVTVRVVESDIIANDDDFTSLSMNRLDGGVTPSVLTDDALNGDRLGNNAVQVNLLDEGGLTGVLISLDGSVFIPEGTPEGSYTLTYQICETVSPTNCDSAIIRLMIMSPDIVANDNDFTNVQLTRIEGGTTPSVLTDDTLNGANLVDGDVIASLQNDGGLIGVRLNTDGTLDVPAMASAGAYVIQYQICETFNPTNCDLATATVLITTSDIVANDNDFTAMPINGADGGRTPSVFANDTLNGADFADGDVIPGLLDLGALAGAAINVDGTLSVPAATPAGTYSVQYQICETQDPTNCDDAIATVLVNPPVIVAEDDDFSPMPINGATGGSLPSIFDNDTLNDAAFDPAEIVVTLNSDGGVLGLMLNSDGTLSIPAGTIAGRYVLDYQICEALNPTNCDRATITLVVVTDASVAGTVFLDANADRALQRDETLLSGYQVEIRVGDTVLASAETDADGAYRFEGLDPDLTYTLVFSDPRTGTMIGRTGPVELAPGEDRTGLDEPVQPSGTVYDVATNEPVSGGTVTVVDETGQPLPAVCFADASQQGQETSAEGYYFFDLVPGAAPECPNSGAVYRLRVMLPNGLTGVFATSPRDVTDGALDPGVCTNDALIGPVCEVSETSERPDAGQMEPFYAAFTIAEGDPEFANNHIPVNSAISLSPLTATKRIRSANATVGSVIVYTITITNAYDVPQVGIDIVDQLPAGLSFIAGSGRLDGLEVEPLVDGRTLTWSGVTVPARDDVEITLGVVAGAGAVVGEYVNTAYADNGPQDVLLSNIAEAAVRITPDEVFDCSEVIGKVFDDQNRNAVQDEAESGLPGVRLATINGLLVTTDEYGRYHIACAATPKPGIGSNFILKLDERTLPTGYTVTTENPRVIRLTQGKMSQLNFGVGAVRPVEFQVRESAFEPDSYTLTPPAFDELATLVEVLMEEVSILTIVYLGENQGDARAQSVKDYVETLWREAGPEYELIIETEVVSSSQNP